MKLFPARRRSSQTGSALFIILICVALFAALSFAVAEMMRSGNPNAATEEKSRLFADEILNYGRALRQATQNIKISNGCKDLDISFENNEVVGYAHTPAVADTCKLFNTDGGATTYLKPVDDWLDMNYTPAPGLRGKWFFPANTCIPGIGTAPSAGCSGDGLDNEALIAILPYIRKEVCVQLNKQLGIDNPGGDPPAETDNAWPVGDTKFIGTETDAEQLDVGGHMTGCFGGSGTDNPPSGTYHFYQVLLPR